MLDGLSCTFCILRAGCAIIQPALRPSVHPPAYAGASYCIIEVVFSMKWQQYQLSIELWVIIMHVLCWFVEFFFDFLLHFCWQLRYFFTSFGIFAFSICNCDNNFIIQYCVYFVYFCCISSAGICGSCLGRFVCAGHMWRMRNICWLCSVFGDSLHLSLSWLLSFYLYLLLYASLSTSLSPPPLPCLTTHPLSLALSFANLCDSFKPDATRRNLSCFRCRLVVVSSFVVVLLVFVAFFASFVVLVVVVAVWGVQTDALIVCHLFSPAQTVAAVAGFIIVAFSFVSFLFLQLFHSLLFNSELTLLLFFFLWLLVLSATRRK